MSGRKNIKFCARAVGSALCYDARVTWQLSSLALIRHFLMRALGLLAISVVMMMLAAMIAPPQAADLGRSPHARRIVYAPPQPVEPPCYWCIRDAIYADTKLIAHLEANPDVDEADKAPWILAARADVHHLRRLLGPVETVSIAPCCYWRKRMYVR
jgi:hypothetical protein